MQIERTRKMGTVKFAPDQSGALDPHSGKKPHPINQKWIKTNIDKSSQKHSQHRHQGVALCPQDVVKHHRQIDKKRAVKDYAQIVFRQKQKLRVADEKAQDEAGAKSAENRGQ